MKVFKALGASILRQISLSGKMKSLSKNDLLDIINMNIEGHKNIEVINSSFTRNELDITFQRYLKNSQQVKGPAKDIPLKYHSQLKGKFRTEEIEKRMSTLFSANKKLLKTMEELKKNIDDLVALDNINLYNCRLSHVAVLGILKESDLFCTYVANMWEMIVTVSSNPADYAKLPGYRIEFLLTNYNHFIEIMNNILLKTGRFYFMSEIDQMKRKDINIKLYSNEQTVDTVVDERSFNSSQTMHFAFGNMLFGIFSLIGETWDDWRHNRYLKNEQLREWIEARNALHKLDLAQIDPDSPEYQKKQKTVEYWDNKITQLDIKINKYLEE